MGRDTRGFTLIEMVIAILVLAVLGTAGAIAITHGALAFNDSTLMLERLSELRLSTERMAREIRQVQVDTGNATGYDITTRDADQLVFVKDDGTTVTLALTGSAVTLGYDNPPGDFTLVDGVASFNLDYYQPDGTVANAGPPSDPVGFVEFELVLNDVNGNSYPQRSRVGLRSQP